jgi:hypothetical protein
LTAVIRIEGTDGINKAHAKARNRTHAALARARQPMAAPDRQEHGGMNLRDEYVQALEAENEQLREKVARSRRPGRADRDAAGARLTGQEAKVFGILLKRELVTKEQAIDVLYGNQAEGGRSRDQDRRRVHLQDAEAS